MNKLRSFLGAALGAFMSIWPAATFDAAWLVLPGAILGWFFGYHGDRFFRGLKHSVVQVRRNIALFAEGAGNLGLETGLEIGRCVAAIGRGLLKVFIWPIKNLFGLVFLYRGCKRLLAHPVNRAEALRTSAHFIGFGTVLYLILVFMAKSLAIQSSGFLGELTLGIVCIAMLVTFMTAFGCLYLLGVTESQKDFYSLWERYTQFKFFFPLFELIRYLVIVLGTQVILWSYVAALTATGLIVAMYLATVTILFGLVRHSLRFSWRVVRYNKDYGIAPLIVGALTGMVVFYGYGSQLVEDPVFRLFAAVVSALVAGSAAVLLVYLIPVLFKVSYTSRQLIMHKGSANQWLLKQKVIVSMIETKYKPLKNWLEQKFEMTMGQILNNKYTFGS